MTSTSDPPAPATVIAALERTSARHAARPAMRRKRDGVWQTVTWAQYRDEALLAARGLIGLGVEPRQGVAILGFNRPEWFVAALGAIAARALPAGVYTTSTPQQFGYIAGHCRAAVAVVEDRQQLERLRAVARGIPSLRATVLMSGEGEGSEILSWRQLLDRGRETPEPRLRERLAAQRPADPCSLIYTSGTTGDPKAVMLSHHNILWTARSVADLLGISPDDRFISYLPLSHVAEQMVSLFAPLVTGSCSAFAESLDKLGENLREIRPHVFFGVPRVWEKIQAGIEAAAAGQPAPRRALLRWARRTGVAAGYAEQGGSRRPALLPLARRLVHSRLRKRLGLDRARICATSAAPISRHTLEFFLGLGIPILEVYGMSECTGPATISLPGRYRTGRAGFAIPGTELATAPDGEIRIRGPHVFLGYYRQEEATREILDGDGWLHSGDIGELDEEGFLRVTDRKKELIITSGGKNVAPQPIEGKLRSIPAVAHGVLVGDGRPYLTALLVLDPAAVEREAATVGSPARDPGEAAACPLFRDLLGRAIEGVNAGLARYETIKRFEILPGDFTVEGGELTPTMKLKRRVINEKYSGEIEALYAAAREG